MVLLSPAERAQVDDAIAKAVFSAPLPSVVEQLVAVLGGPNVAVIGDVRATSAVGEWIRGAREPRGDREQRLRLALQAALTIRERHGDKTVRAWFLGANHRLDDHMPITVIATSRDLGEMQRTVLAAARAFVAG
ncbi:MAG: hypothetical protein JO103_07730 [Candidatus Eremiobacteraeota bacterium]|nr:hypothetical protein [Candidatus Eremiobacteraeota bacterium]